MMGVKRPAFIGILQQQTITLINFSILRDTFWNPSIIIPLIQIAHEFITDSFIYEMSI